MTLTNEQFTEAGFIFESQNGVVHGDYENNLIVTSELNWYQPAELEQLIVNGVNSGLYRNDEERVGVFGHHEKVLISLNFD